VTNWLGYEVIWPVCRHSGRAGGVFAPADSGCSRSIREGDCTVARSLTVEVWNVAGRP